MIPIPIGTNSSGEVFSIMAEDRRKHMAILGKSGVGKISLLRNMIAYDIQAGLGATVIDPHGALIEDLLELIPRQRTNDVIYFNPREPSSVLGINILEPVSTEYQALTVSALINIFHTLWKDCWGPRLEDILRNSAFALLEQPHPVSLVALPKLLTEPSYRAQVMRHVSNPVVRDFFEVFEKGWDKNFREEAISPVLNKVRAFTVNPIIRDVIGQPKSSFDFRQAMDSAKSFFAICPRERWAKMSARF